MVTESAITATTSAKDRAYHCLADRARADGLYAVGSISGTPTLAVVDAPDLPRAPTLLHVSGSRISFYRLTPRMAFDLAMAQEGWQ